MAPSSSNRSAPAREAPYRPPPPASGVEAITYRIRRIMRTLTAKWGRALKIIIAVAGGVGIAIAIIAASEGINRKVNELLVSRGSIDDLNAAGIDLPAIQSVLIDTRNLLKQLAIGATVAIVGMVMWASMPQRRREISIARQEGQTLCAVMIELGVESIILCVTGGLFGILLGLTLCRLIHWRIPLLPMSPTVGGVVAVFPVTVVITFVVMAVIAFLLATIYRDLDR